MRTRFVIGGAGALVGVYGAVLLLQQGLANLWATGLWLAGGIVAHDFLWAPLVLAVSFVGARAVPKGRSDLTAVAVIIGLVTVSAIPVLGRFGARPDNPTLLPRNYLGGWLVFVGVVLVGYGVVVVLRRITTRTRGQ